MTAVRIGTWNVENLFQVGQEGGPPDEPTYEAKLTSLAGVIDELAPDVLAVQEVGSPEALADLTHRIGGAWHVELADPDERGIRVGFISRAALQNVTQVAAFPDKLAPIQADDTGAVISSMGRPALSARLTTGGTNFDLVTCHLKSKLLSFPNGFSTKDEGLRARFAVYALARRAAEAATVRAHATALLEGHGQQRRVLVMGDLNDEPEAATTQIFLGPPGSEIGTAGFPQPDGGDGARLWNLAPLIPEANRYSRIYRSRRELIDHLMVSHAVAVAVKEGDIDFHATAPRSITDTPTATTQAPPGSDHRPLLLTLT